MIEVVEGGPADRDLVADYIGQLYAIDTENPTGRPVHLSRADDMLAAGPVYFLRRDGEVIGYAALKEMGDHMFVRHFVIDARLRGAGLGTAAFRALQAACFPDRQVRLDASHRISGPREFWEAQGFQIMSYTMRRAAEDAA